MILFMERIYISATIYCGLSRCRTDSSTITHNSKIRLPSCYLCTCVYSIHSAAFRESYLLATGVWDSGSCLRGLTTFMVNKIRSPVTYWPVSQLGQPLTVPAGSRGGALSVRLIFDWLSGRAYPCSATHLPVRPSPIEHRRPVRSRYSIQSIPTRFKTQPVSGR